jgi:hypothetical protein
MNYDTWSAAVNPKTLGSWNLVQCVSTYRQSPWYLFLSSSAGIIGNRGQANYAAGNCFQDALANSLCLKGQQAASIDLGPVLGTGMVAENDKILELLKAAGFYSIRHRDFLTVVECAVAGMIPSREPMPGQIVLGIGSGGLIRQNKPADPYWSRTALYSRMAEVDMGPTPKSEETVARSNDFRSELAACEDCETAVRIISEGLVVVLAKILGVAPNEIDTARPPSEYGVDSLAAISMRAWVRSQVGVDVSVFEVLSDRTVLDLSMDIANRGGWGMEVLHRDEVGGDPG